MAGRFISEAEMPQRSDKWLAWRKTVGTATQAATIMGEPARGAAQTWNDLRMERAFGSTFEGNAATEHGVKTEPEALAAFNKVMEKQYVPVAVETVIDKQNGTKIGASLDGYFWDAENQMHEWVEIKCPYTGDRSQVWKDIRSGSVTRYYYWQMVHQCAALTFGERSTALGIFFVYLGPEVYEVLALDNGFMAEDMSELAYQWHRFLSGKNQTGDMSQNREWRELERRYQEAHLASDSANKEKQQAKGEMLQLFKQELGTETVIPKKIFGDSLNLTQKTVNRMDWKAFREANPDLDYDEYLVPSEQWSVHMKEAAQ